MEISQLVYSVCRFRAMILLLLGTLAAIPPSNAQISSAESKSGCSTSSLTTLKVCEPYMWNGTLYASSGTYNYVTVNSAGCDSVATLSLYVTTYAINTPDTIFGPRNACPYTNTPYEATYYIKKVPTATSYLWTVPNFATITSHPAGPGANDTVIKVKYNNDFHVNNKLTVTAIAACGQSLAAWVMITREPITAPVTVFGPTDVCPFMRSSGNPAGTKVAYYINSVPYATSYEWQAPYGSTIVSHPRGTGINDTVVEVIFNSNFVSGSLLVRATNGCGTSAQRSVLLRRVLPLAPGPITGPLNGCPLIGAAPVTYSISPVANAASYEWTLPEGMVPVSPSTDTSILVNFNGNFSGGSITVKANSNCGSSGLRTMVVSGSLPSPPGMISITPLATGCPNKQYRYTIPALPVNATEVEWTVPTGTYILSGQGTLSIHVFYPGTGFVRTGSVSVAGKNGCGYGTPRSINLNLPACALQRSLPDTEIPEIGGSSGIDAKIFPNPSASHFILADRRGLTTSAEVLILDIRGITIRRFRWSPGTDLLFGNDLPVGTYMVQIKQARHTNVIKIVKY